MKYGPNILTTNMYHSDVEDAMNMGIFQTLSAKEGGDARGGNKGARRWILEGIK